jgi:tetratricopeptide (TPR) repeat protein
MRKIIIATIIMLCLPSSVFAGSIEKAEFLHQHSLIDDAKRELIDVIFDKASHPKDKAKACYLLGNIAFSENKIKAALKSWKYLTETYPESSEAMLVADRIAELSEIVTGDSKEMIDNAMAVAYLKNAEFWSEGKNDVFKIGLSRMGRVEAALEWYDKIIAEFPDPSASRVAYVGKMNTLLGWTELGKDGASYGIRRDFDKYIPQLIETFQDYERKYPNSSDLQALRYQIAQGYWLEALKFAKVGSIYKGDPSSGRYYQTAKKHADASKMWLKKIIETSEGLDSFYYDLANRRLREFGIEIPGVD